MNFQQKVQSMTAKEIILAMVESLLHPKIKVSMGTFGMVQRSTTKGKKFLWWTIEEPKQTLNLVGCAATTTAIEISGQTFTENSIRSTIERAESLGVSSDWYGNFETAIDSLRSGFVDSYNHYAAKVGIAEIRSTGKHLPHLSNNYTEADLQQFVNLAVSQPEPEIREELPDNTILTLN